MDELDLCTGSTTDQVGTCFLVAVVVLWRFVVAVLGRGAWFGATVWHVEDI